MFRSIFSLAPLLLPGCVASSTLPLSADTVQITTQAAPVCGAAGAQKVALRRAASETLSRGYSRFIILNGQLQANTELIGYTPVVAQSTGSATAWGQGNTAFATGSSTTTYSGGMPITATSHSQGLIVKMFNDGDPAGKMALDAKATLGPDWQKAMKDPNPTCID